MAREEIRRRTMRSLLALALLVAFWPSGASAKNDKIDERDTICAAYKGTALWGQCTRAVTHDCQDSSLAAPQCKRWAQAWRDQTGDTQPPWLLLCGVADSKCVFVTSETFTGNLVQAAQGSPYNGNPSNGLEAGDLICQHLADAPGSRAAPGTYKAWLSATTIQTAADRLTHALVPYVRVDGARVADDWSDLTTCEVDAGSGQCWGSKNPVGVTERLAPPQVSLVWTNTGDGGDLPRNDRRADCVAWTSSDGSQDGEGGDPQSYNQDWTDYYRASCDVEAALYCFQQ